MIPNLKALVRKTDNGYPRWIISLVFLGDSQDCTIKYFITASSGNVPDLTHTKEINGEIITSFLATGINSTSLP
jgi:hypothetical protein